MVAKNEHTGDTLASKASTGEAKKNYDEAWERTFGAKKKNTLDDSDKKCECFHWGSCCGASTEGTD